MRGDKLIICPTDLLVKFDVRSAAQAATLSGNCRMKNAADEKGVIPDVRPEQERLLGSCAVQRDQNVGNVLFGEMMRFIGDLQATRVRKGFEQRRHIIAKLAVADSALLQNVPGQHVKIKLRRNPQMPAVIQDCIDQARMIENGIARLDIAQQIDQRHLIGLRPRERAHDEIEIGRRKPRPTIRPDHRDFIMRDARADGKSDPKRRIEAH